MISISRFKIGKTITIGFTGAVVFFAFLGGLALWSLQAIHSAMNISETEGRMMTMAEKISADQGAIAQRVATMTLAGHAGEEIMARLLSIRSGYMATFDKLKEMENTKEGKPLLDQAVQAAAQWRDADNSLISLLKAGKPAEAANLHRDLVVSRFNELGSTIAAYVKFREQKLIDINTETTTLISRVTRALVFFGLINVIGVLSFGYVLSRGIAVPLAKVTNNLNEIAHGDLSRDAPPEFQARGDEIGTLARAQQTMLMSLRKTVEEISNNISLLSSSSAQLMTNSTQMTAGSSLASDKSRSVSVAAEEMSSNITSVAAGMEQTTTNLAHVASTTEQMTCTIGEIAENSEKARRITDEATRQAARITEHVNQLGVAASEIGKVTETITEISSQTNLLALNATIEAARAGSAGKGFAVVATEIKALAQQTAAATEDIKARIAGVQSASTQGITEIGKISQIILDVSGIVASIAAAIEQQSTATKDIARNIAEASVGVTDANTRVAETSHASREIAKDIVSVDRSMRDMANGSDHVRISAGELTNVAEGLKVTLGRFYS